MIFYQGAGGKNWKPNLNDPSQAVGAGISGIADWFGGSFGSGGAAVTPGLPGTGAATPGAGLAGIEGITSLVNQINQRAQQSANAGRIPNALGLEGQSSANIGDALAGKLDSSVINLLGQQSAERGAMSGSPLGANSNADYLRSLGLTSLDLMNTGQNWLTQATGRNPAAPIYNAGNQVLTAGQVQDAILAREQMENNLRIAQLRNLRGDGGYGGGYRGGGGGGGSPIASTASNWVNPIKPTTTAGTGWSFPAGYWDIQGSGGPPMGTPGGQAFPWGTEGADSFNVGSMIEGEDDWADFEDWFYRDGT